MKPEVIFNLKLEYAARNGCGFQRVVPNEVINIQPLNFDYLPLYVLVQGDCSIHKVICPLRVFVGMGFQL